MPLSTVVTRLQTNAPVAGLPRAYSLSALLALPEITHAWLPEPRFFREDNRFWDPLKGGITLEASNPAGAAAHSFGTANNGNTPYIEMSSSQANSYGVATQVVPVTDYTLLFGFMPYTGVDDPSAPVNATDTFPIMDGSAKFLSPQWDRDGGQMTVKDELTANGALPGISQNLGSWAWYASALDRSVPTGYLSQNEISRFRSAPVSFNNSGTFVLGHPQLSCRLSLILIANADLTNSYPNTDLIEGFMTEMHRVG
ncbi:hypothetical protein [Salipiger marinus]|uniref:Uncharacterized protein n=1 Tax=Salipiger marinus TaxID=555512 RepID=A0A1G8V0X2_9RHOB|nr:hypothetical protein [Salipiger marinus]SDJ58985.1 hypothetical protein SAMN04487993_10576 [Salipiger marinus]